jgi:hypothetical protein
MSALAHACEVISEAGCYFDNAVSDPAEFDRRDRETRVTVAAAALVDWLSGALVDGADINRLAKVVATAMLHQHDHDEREHERSERDQAEFNAMIDRIPGTYSGPTKGNTTNLHDDHFKMLLGNMMLALKGELQGWDTTGSITPATLRAVFLAAVAKLDPSDFGDADV